MKTRSHGPADVGSGIGLPQGTKGVAKKAVQRAKAFQQAARASSKSHARAQAAQDKRQRAQRQRDGPGPAGPAAREEELAFGHVEYAAAAGHVDGKRKASKKALLEQALQEKARLEQLAGHLGETLRPNDLDCAFGTEGSTVDSRLLPFTSSSLRTGRI